MALALIVNFSVAEANREQAVRLMRLLEEHTRREPGCIHYIAQQSVDEPLRFVLYELYRDQAALDAHRASPHCAEYAAGALLPLMVGRAAGRFQTVS